MDNEMKDNGMTYLGWHKSWKLLHEYYQQNLISEEFKKKDAELTKEIDRLKEERRKLRYENTVNENTWVCRKIKEIREQK